MLRPQWHTTRRRERKSGTASAVLNRYRQQHQAYLPYQRSTGATQMLVATNVAGIRMSKIGVVFVHGLTGGEDTWKNSNGQSFGQLLTNSSIGDKLEIHEFNYYTKIITLFETAFVKRLIGRLPVIKHLGFLQGKIQNNQPIEQLSEMLDTYIRLYLSHLDEIVLIAHSLGGLVAKDYILNGCTSESSRPIGFISIAVPHKGALSALLLAPLNKNATELAPLHAYPDKLNGEWVDRKDSLPKTIYVVAAHDECVSKVSAIPYKVGKADVFSVPHDHVSVCKPEDEEDPVFKCTFKFIDEVLKEKKLKSELQVVFPANSPIYDKEIFVIKMIVCDIGPKGVANAKESFFHAEIIEKASSKKDREFLLELQSRVINLYRAVYNEHDGKCSPNDVFAKVHNKIIDENADSLKCSVEFLTYLHKQGMLHQVANVLNDNVVWSEKTDLTEVEAKTK